LRALEAHQIGGGALAYLALEPSCYLPATVRVDPT